MTKKKHPLEIERDERAKTDPCRHCGHHNQDPNFKGYRFYTGECKNCGKTMDHSYLFAPWSMTWEELANLRGHFKDIFNRNK